MLGKIKGRRRGRQRMSLLDGIIHTMVMSLSKLWEIVKDREIWGHSIWGHKESDTILSSRLNGKLHGSRWQLPQGLKGKLA